MIIQTYITFAIHLRDLRLLCFDLHHKNKIYFNKNNCIYVKFSFSLIYFLFFWLKNTRNFDFSKI